MHKLIKLFQKKQIRFKTATGLTLLKATIISLLCFYLSACGTMGNFGGASSSPQESINPKAKVGNTTIYAQPTESSSFYESKAAQASGSDKVNWSLLAAKAYLKEGNSSATDNKLLEIQAQLTNDPQLAEWHLISAQSELAQGALDKAVMTLSFPSTWKLDNDQYRRYYGLRSELQRRNGDLFASVAALVSGDEYFTDASARRNNENQLWQTLMQIPADQMTSVSIDRSNGVLFGWLELAYMKKTKTDPNEYTMALNEWIKQHPRHPAVSFFSDTSGQAMSAPVSLSRYKNIAILLPLSGRFESIGTIIRDGVADAYNNDPAKGDHTLNIYDDNADMATLYAQLQSQGVDLVVGPLQKDKVIEYKNINQGKITTLLLHKGDGSAAPNTCQFLLSPEDEAAQVADKMAADQQNSPMVLAPRNTYGQTMANVFVNRWTQISAGLPVVSNYYGDQSTINSDMKTAMSTQASAIYLIGGTNDIVINVPYMQANAPRAKLPPIYTSSRANSGSNNSFSELKGINYSDIPVLVNQDAEFLALYHSQHKNNDYAKMRFYAQGMDAYRLIDGLSQLQASPGYAIEGRSGSLVLDNSTCTVMRKFSWGIFGSTPLPPETDEISSSSNILDIDSSVQPTSMEPRRL